MTESWMHRWFGKGRSAPVMPERHAVTLPMVGEVMVSRTLDCIGAACPRPQLLTMRVLEQLRDGEVIELLSDNPATVETLPALMFAMCGTHLITVKEVDYWRIYMRKGL